MNLFCPKIFLGLYFLLIILTFSNAQATELSDNSSYTTYEISLDESLVITDDVKLFLPNTFTVYLFDALSISDNNISHDAHSAASTENFVPPNPMSKDVRDSVEATTSFLTHLGSFGV